jgi:hypothetical protein
MLSKTTSYHLEIQTHRKNPYGLIRNSYREEGKVKHETLCRLTGLLMERLRKIQTALQGKVVSKNDFKIIRSLEYGASAALHSLAMDIRLPNIIYSQPGEPWVKDCKVMIIGRIVYAGSKLSLSHCGAYSALWSI